MTDHIATSQHLASLRLTPAHGLPLPFHEIAILRADAPPTYRVDVPHLRYALTALRLTAGGVQTAAELWVAATETDLQADLPLPAAGAGLLVVADGLAAPGPQPEPPRALSPGIDLRLLAGSGFGRESDVLAGQSCALAVVRLARMMRFEFRPEHARRVVLVAAGSVSCGGQTLGAGEWHTQDDARTFYIDALEASVLVLFAGAA